jgi:hypothetical protein
MRQLIGTGLLLALAAAGLPACSNSGGTSKAPDTVTTSGVQPRNDVTTMDGCLRAGVAGGFVLIATNTDTANPTANVELIGSSGVKLDDYLGQRVEAAGTIVSDQRVAATSGATPEKPANGAAGTPTVSTTEHLDVKRMQVSSIKATGDRCGEK